MAKKSPRAWGGIREGSGRKSLFPGKHAPKSGQKVTITLTTVAIEAVKKKAQELTEKKPNVAAAEHVTTVSFSDAVEYCVRRATNTALED
jgi:hypothetical protein